MAKLLKVYFIHSDKINCNDKIYLPCLRSEVLSTHTLMFRNSDKYVNKYYKDVMDEADVYVVDLTSADVGLNTELKYAITSNKPMLALADASIGYEQKYTKLIKNVIGYKDEKDFRYFVETFVNNYKDKINEGHVDNTVVLGVLN